MKKIITLLPLAVVVLLFASGCATITRGPNQAVPIKSTPAGATVTVDGKRVGKTPITAKLSRKRAHTVELTKDHYHTHTANLLTVPNEASKAYVRFGIDEATGAYTDLTPNRINVELDPIILPEEPVDNPVSDLANRISDLDDQLAAGEISAEDHKYIMQRLFRFYQD